MNPWFILRVLAILALIGFTITGLAFLTAPAVFTGEVIDVGSSLWHSLSIAFMATVAMIAFLIALNPMVYWYMLLPLAVGKLTSSTVSLYWYLVFRGESAPTMLILNSVVDGLIGILSLVIYISITRITRSARGEV